jgi:hypothetical protein
MEQALLLLAGLFIIVIVCYCLTRKEGFSIFKNLRSKPTTRIQPPYTNPWCTNELGHPIPCPGGCQYTCPSCMWDWPVPVLGANLGANSPNKWCPGPPIC